MQLQVYFGFQDYELTFISKPLLLDIIVATASTMAPAAQVMYNGPYSDEGPTIIGPHKFIEEQDGAVDENNKHHHEIYLGDPRRTAPEKLKTIIRQPF